MSDQVEIMTGSRPWEPSFGAHLGEVLHRYDRPLVGFFDQYGTRFLFRCWAGEVERANIWAYIRVDEAEVADLVQAPADSFDELVDRLSEGRPGALAVAVDDRIVAWSTVPDLDADLSYIIESLARQALLVLREEGDAIREVSHVG